MTRIDVRLEPIASMRGEVEELLIEHYRELTKDKEIIKLDPDWDRYLAMQEANVLDSFSAREEGKLIGYAVFFVTRHLHYKSNIIAKNDVLFLLREHRQGSTGLRLIRACEKRMKERGVSKILWHVKFGTNLGEILEIMGYRPEEYTVGKVL